MGKPEKLGTYQPQAQAGGEEEAGAGRNGHVLVAVKTPMMPQPTTALVDGSLTLAESLAALRGLPPKDDNARRVLAQLARETGGAAYDFLVVSGDGSVSKADPKTPVRTVAVPREVRTAQGLETLLVASYEVQAYAKVGA